MTAAQALAVSKQRALEAMTVIQKHLHDLEAVVLRNPDDWWAATEAHAIEADLASIVNRRPLRSKRPLGDR